MDSFSQLFAKVVERLSPRPTLTRDAATADAEPEPGERERSARHEWRLLQEQEIQQAQEVQTSLRQAYDLQMQELIQRETIESIRTRRNREEENNMAVCRSNDASGFLLDSPRTITPYKRVTIDRKMVVRYAIENKIILCPEALNSGLIKVEPICVSDGQPEHLAVNPALKSICEKAMCIGAVCGKLNGCRGSAIYIDSWKTSWKTVENIVNEEIEAERAAPPDNVRTVIMPEREDSKIIGLIKDLADALEASLIVDRNSENIPDYILGRGLLQPEIPLGSLVNSYADPRAELQVVPENDGIRVVHVLRPDTDDDNQSNEGE